MDRRSEPRILTDLPATVTVLPDGPVYAARLVDLSGRGMRLMLSNPVPTNAALAVEANGGMYLGEVAYCRSAGDSWHAGVEVEQCFRDTTDLANLRWAIQESLREPSQHPHPAEK